MNAHKIPPPQLTIASSDEWEEHALVDSGNGLKLERFGRYKLIRPEAEALWKPALPEAEWEKADGRFIPSTEENGGHWEGKSKLPTTWTIDYKGMRMKLETGRSRHVGVFPEQACQWDWMRERIDFEKRPLKVLNLFGYTGLASLAAGMAGAQVTHVDASRKAVNWAHENQVLSGLEKKPIRWIVDDALKFVQRESRRANRYDGIILDPPKFGRGPKGEVWEFYKLITELLRSCMDLLSKKPVFVIITAYAVKASAITLYYTLSELMDTLPGKVEAGEIALREESAGRLLPTAIFAHWLAET